MGNCRLFPPDTPILAMPYDSVNNPKTPASKTYSTFTNDPVTFRLPSRSGAKGFEED